MAAVYATIPQSLSIASGSLASLVRARGKSAGGRGLELTQQALQRLGNTEIKTDLFATHRPVRLLENLQFGSHGAWCARVPDLLIHAFSEPEAIELSARVLHLRGFQRRLAGWAHVLCADRGNASLPMTDVYARSGSHDDLRKFRHALRRAVGSLQLPPFKIQIVSRARQDWLEFSRQLRCSN